MTNFSFKNILLFIFIIFLTEKLASEELILPKPQPKIEKLTKEEIILPKSQPDNNELSKEKETKSGYGYQSNIEELTKKEIILPKPKPLLDKKTKLQAEKKKYLLPQKKPIKETKDKKKTSKIESKDEIKVVKEIDDSKLILPKKKANYLQKTNKKSCFFV